MRGRRLLSMALLCLAAPGLAATAQSRVPREARQLVEQMARAVQQLDYEGTFVYQHRDQLKTMRIVRSRESGAEQERLVSLNGSPREVVREGSKISCVFPGSEQVLEWRQTSVRFSGLGVASFARLEQSYDFRTLGIDRVASRRVDVVAVLPKDAYRYGYRLYLDQDTGFPLKSDLLDETGQSIEQVMFTDLRILPDSGRAAPATETSILDPAPAPAPAPAGLPQSIPPDTDAWTFGDLPAGFSLSRQGPGGVPVGEHRPEHFIFSDGLASLSVFVEAGSPDAGLKGGSRMGANHAWGAWVDGHQITVVGEVPLATVRMVAEGMRHVASAGAGP
jgi:sigma-E factor negative regulatory protein RseB